MVGLDRAPDYNLFARNFYPATGGVTDAQAGSAANPATTADPTDMIPQDNEVLVPLQRALQVGLLGEPVRWWLALAFLLFGGMWVVNRFGGGTFANIKFTLYNVIAVTLIAIVGPSIAKVVFTRFPVPGITTIVLAS